LVILLCHTKVNESENNERRERNIVVFNGEREVAASIMLLNGTGCGKHVEIASILTTVIRN
jgi:hypothetical protein